MLMIYIMLVILLISIIVFFIAMYFNFKELNVKLVEQKKITNVNSEDLHTDVLLLKNKISLYDSKFTYLEDELLLLSNLVKESHSSLSNPYLHTLPPTFTTVLSEKSSVRTKEITNELFGSIKEPFETKNDFVWN